MIALFAPGKVSKVLKKKYRGKEEGVIAMVIAIALAIMLDFLLISKVIAMIRAIEKEIAGAEGLEGPHGKAPTTLKTVEAFNACKVVKNIKALTGFVGSCEDLTRLHEAISRFVWL